MALDRFVALLAACPLWSIACGGSTPAPEAAMPETAQASDPVPRDAPEPTEPPPSEGAEAEPATEPSAAPAEPSAADTDTARREIKYFVSPDGMRVEIAGVQLTPTAEAVKLGSAWGVKVQVQARARDGKSHSLLAPKGGELAFAGSVVRQQGEPEEFDDRREGDDEITLAADQAAKLSRAWPSKAGPKPVAAGDELRLSVGLWGLGDEASSRRPVRKLCVVTLKVEKGKAKLTVKPPEGISK